MQYARLLPASVLRCNSVLEARGFSRPMDTPFRFTDRRQYMGDDFLQQLRYACLTHEGP